LYVGHAAAYAAASPKPCSLRRRGHSTGASYA